jgi:hypothetical protein
MEATLTQDDRIDVSPLTLGVTLRLRWCRRGSRLRWLACRDARSGSGDHAGVFPQLYHAAPHSPGIPRC